MTGDKIKTFEENIMLDHGFQINQLSLINSENGKNSNLLIVSDKNERANYKNLLKTMSIRLSVSDMEKLGKLLLERAEQIKKQV